MDSRILTTSKSTCTERHPEAALLGGDDEIDGRGEGGHRRAADGDAEESGGDWEGSLMENTLNSVNSIK